MARSLSRRRYDNSPSRSRSSSRSSSTSSSSSASSSPSSSSASRSSTSSSSSSSSRRSSRSGVSDKRRSVSPVTKIQVTRLTKNVNKNHVMEIFKSYGPIKSLDMPFDKYHPHLNRGSAFIEFEKSEEAENAIKYMDGGQIDGQEISVARCYGNAKSNTSQKQSYRSRGGPPRNGPGWRRGGNVSPPSKR